MELQKHTNYLVQCWAEDLDSPDRYGIIRVLDFDEKQVLIALIDDFNILYNPDERSEWESLTLENIDEYSMIAQHYIDECCTVWDRINGSEMFKTVLGVDIEILSDVGQQTSGSLKSRNEEVIRCGYLHSNTTVNYAKMIVRALGENDLKLAFQLTNQQYA